MKLQKLSINTRNLWVMRMFFLLINSGAGAIFPFITLFYRQNGLSGTEIGFLGTISSLMALMVAPIWGRWNDRARQPRQLLQIALIGSGLVNLLLSQQSFFVFIAVLVGMDALLSAGVDPLMSTQAVAVAEAEGSAGFGSIRLWGSLGWAIAAPLSGWIIQQTGITAVFYIYAAFCLLSVLLLSLLNTANTRRSPLVPQEHASMREVLNNIWQNRELMGLIIASIIVWATANGSGRFETIYLTQLGAKEDVIGWVNTVGAVVEIPIMLWADRIQRRRGSAITLKVSFFIYIFGFIFVLIHPSVATIFIMRFVNGIAYAFYVVAFTSFIVERAPAGQSATVLALYSITIASTVNIIASPLSGMLFDFAGAYWLYAIAMGGYLIGWGILMWTVRSRRAAA
jgi:MFS transporter, PPP family, 3-phenylpropionic acid transporter